MMELKKVIYKVSLKMTIGSVNIRVNDISFDSREVKKNNIFVALKGSIDNGFKYIDKAILNGANSIICEEVPEVIDKKITYLIVQDSKRALAIISNNFYDNPSKKICLIGITGTNGKTTTVTLLYELLKSLGFKVGMISTISFKYNGIDENTLHTTPDSITLNQYLRRMVDHGIEYCFMEVSSHGIDQSRIFGLNFKGGVFLNISHDHLDYHKTFKDYRDVKKTFFDQLPKEAFALSNFDDKNGKYILQNTLADKKSFSINSYSDYNAVILESDFSGMLIKINNTDFWTHLIGKYNASNLLAVYSVAMLLKLDSINVLSHLSKLKNVRGRFDIINAKKAKIIIDYAHTPDALKNVLTSINEIRKDFKKLITVVGCGGDRDKKKRPLIGKIASIKSDKVIFTSDNPRNEDPKKIIESMNNGVPSECIKKVINVINREEAIRKAFSMLKSGDVLLIAGKGHEEFQEVKGRKKPFNEYKIVKEIISEIK